MAEGDVTATGTLTLPTSGPGVISTVTVTDASVGATDLILITATNAVKDVKGTHEAYVSTVSSGSFVITAKREQLTSDATYNYISIAST